eukprot:scaffold7055_cov254-Pinguiococcus_pyrenoidosus.AAC.16
MPAEGPRKGTQKAGAPGAQYKKHKVSGCRHHAKRFGVSLPNRATVMGTVLEQGKEQSEPKQKHCEASSAQMHRNAEGRDEDRVVLAAVIRRVRFHLQSGRRLTAADGGRDGAERQHRAHMIRHALVVRARAVRTEAAAGRKLAEETLLRRTDQIAVVAAAALDHAPILLELRDHPGLRIFYRALLPP